MSLSQGTTTGSASATGTLRSNTVTLAAFAAALSLSAFLLFSVQPMFAKMVLPKLGGSPAVWSVAMVFFQSALLAGYAYSHFLVSRLSLRAAALIHLTVMGAVLAVALPIGLASGCGRPPAQGQALWLMGLFAVSIGLPFFAVSANAPLLQAWFARTGHPHSRDPYFLYGASNIGSLLALLSYPILVEPLTTLGQQARLWTWGFGLLLAAVALCGSFVVRMREKPVAAPASSPQETITWKRRAPWIGLAFVPSALLVAVTTHISTDVAAAPFLWVVPLSLFLVTFIVTFQRRPILPHALMLRLQPLVIGLVAISLIGVLSFNWPVTIALNLAGFFVTAMVCHGEMVRRRPQASHLSQFYLSMSAGGVLGGLFSGLLAPVIFSSVAEYPLLIIAGLLCRPHVLEVGDRKRRLAESLAILTGAAFLAMPGLAFGWIVPDWALLPYRLALVALSGLMMLQANSPERLASLLGAALLLSFAYGVSLRPQETIRSFFGVHKITETPDGQFRLLMHGTTIHGAVRIRARDGAAVHGTPTPTTYYHRDGAIAQAILAARQAQGALHRVAIVGVGTGSLACYKEDGESWTFFEIDSDVVRIARDPSRFGFVQSCAPAAAFVLGDARLTLGDAANRSFDVLVIDAFTSDAIPVHLLTKEAMALYFEKLGEHGIAVIHLSNRNMELSSVVAAIAAEQGLVVWTKDRAVLNGSDFEVDPIAAVVARREADLEPLTTMAGWRALPPDPSVRPWTDDYADIIAAIWRRFTRS